MPSLLAVEPWIVTAVVLGVLSVVTLVLIVIAPWKAVRQEPPLDEEVETRLLLGEDPEQIAEDEEAAEEPEPAARTEPTGPAA